MTEEQINNAVLAGGVEVEVQYRAGERRAEDSVALPGKVFVRELAVKEYPNLLAALDDEERQVEIFTGQPAGWGKMLRPASLNEIMQAGEALNKEPFFGWHARRVDRLRVLKPAELKAIEKKALAMMEEAWRNGSPKLPTPAA